MRKSQSVGTTDRKQSKMSKRKRNSDINTRASKRERNEETAPTSLDDPVTNARSSSSRKKGSDDKRAFLCVNYNCKKCGHVASGQRVGLNVRTFLDPISGFNHHQVSHMLAYDAGSRADPSNPSIYTKNLMKILNRIEKGRAAYQEAKIAAQDDEIRILKEGDLKK